MGFGEGEEGGEEGFWGVGVGGVGGHCVRGGVEWSGVEWNVLGKGFCVGVI